MTVSSVFIASKEDDDERGRAKVDEEDDEQIGYVRRAARTILKLNRNQSET